MKVRKGFVSNSSSSSFIIMFKKDEADKILSKHNPFLMELFQNRYDNDSVFGIPVYCDFSLNLQGYDYDEDGRQYLSHNEDNTALRDYLYAEFDDGDSWGNPRDVDDIDYDDWKEMENAAIEKAEEILNQSKCCTYRKRCGD